MSASYTMLIPFLPMYLVRELGVSQSEVTMWSGVVFSVTFLIGGIMAPVWGKMADTHGKKPMAIRSGLGLALSYLLGGMVTSPEQMVGVRVLQGFAAGLWSVCLAIATSSVPVGKLGMSLGILQSGLTAGNVIGPLIGGVLASMFGMRTSFYLGGAVLFMITLVFWFYIPEPPGSKASKEEAANEPATALLKNAPIREALICSGIVQMVILLIQPIISLYVEKLYHGTDNIIFCCRAGIFSGGHCQCHDGAVLGTLRAKQGLLPVAGTFFRLCGRGNDYAVGAFFLTFVCGA